MSKSKNSRNQKLKIVGIGASASGLQALEIFFSNCPIDSGLSFVIIQHLSPDFKSMQPDLLARKTKMPISVATESLAIKPNHIYLIPDNKNIVLKKDKLQLLPRAPHPELNLPIDLFFNALAAEKKEAAIGIILSGSGSDGTKGAAAIKEAGGIVFVQNPEESGFDGMPLSVIHAGLADSILNVNQIPNELLSFFNFSDKKNMEIEENLIDPILELLKNETKYDFTAYRKQTLNRRIEKRKSINKLNTLSEYKSFLEKNEEEQDILVSEFLIGVTSFFRDKEHFSLLEEKVIPQIIKDKANGEIIKLWAIGSVTGEEAYSIAILLKEALIKNPKDLDFKIFATDINLKAIEKASKGYFGQQISADIKPEYLAKYFKRKDTGFVVQPHLRKHIVFSHHDILHNPPFNKMDLVSCRNMLIYFQDSAQEKTLKSILYALNLNGYLFLGSSESLGVYSKYFEVTNHRAKIYKKKLEFDNKTSGSNIFPVIIKKSSPQKLSGFASELTVQFTKKLALLTNSVCICVNENIQVLEAYGSLRLVGSLPFEGFSTNLLKLLPKEFHVPVATAIRTLSKSSKEKMALTKQVKFVADNKTYFANIIFDRFDQRTYPHEKFYLIAIKVEEPTLDHIPQPITDKETASNNEVQQLQHLLDDTKDNLQLTIEELESSNEEAQATNEELVSSNEELQSTNEELQSVNEELYTVNAELQEKNIQLLELNSDIENLINSSHIATLFLDERLHIRRFTSSITNIINLRETDIGRSISNFSLPDHHFLNDVKSISDDNKVFRKEIQINNLTWYLQEIHYYVSIGDNVQGTIINYTDITELKQGVLDLKEKTKMLNDILELTLGHVFIIDLLEQKIVYASPSVKELVEYTPKEIYEMGISLFEKILHPDDLEKIKMHYKKVGQAKEHEMHTIQFRLISKNKKTIWVESLDKPYERNTDGSVKTFVGITKVIDK